MYRGRSTRFSTVESSVSGSPDRTLNEAEADEDFVLVDADSGGGENASSTTLINDQIPAFVNMVVSKSGERSPSSYSSSDTLDGDDMIGSPRTEMSICPEDRDIKIEEFYVQPINRLPPELLIAIFQKLISPTDLRNCMLVSKHWASCSVELLWHRPVLMSWPKFENVVKSLRADRPTFPYASLIRRLNLTLLYKDISDGTLHSLELCTRLERLTLSNCKAVSDIGLQSVIPNNPNLLALDLMNVEEVTDSTLHLIAKHCRRLQGLNIAGCKKITDSSLISISESCRYLKRIKLHECDQVTDDGVIALAEHCPQIIEVDLNKCDKITDEAVTSILTNLKQLREIHLAFCVRITDYAFHNAPERVVDSLRVIDLTSCELITDEGVRRIIYLFPKIRNLMLAKCKNITDNGVNSICRLGKWIHYLALGHCREITDTAVRKIVVECNRIRYIDLAGCTNLTDASVAELGNLPKLKRVGLVKCDLITDDGIIDMVDRQSECTLERVHLSYCTRLTHKGITKLVNKCLALNHLSLTGIETFYVDKDLTKYCRAPPPDFTPAQRDLFCVFSGPNVGKIRLELIRRAAVRSPPLENDNDIPINFGWGANNSV